MKIGYVNSWCKLYLVGGRAISKVGRKIWNDGAHHGWMHWKPAELSYFHGLRIFQAFFLSLRIRTSNCRLNDVLRVPIIFYGLHHIVAFMVFEYSGVLTALLTFLVRISCEFLFDRMSGSPAHQKFEINIKKDRCNIIDLSILRN